MQTKFVIDTLSFEEKMSRLLNDASINQEEEK